MGDSGAYFFGFVLAASSILGSLKITTVFALFPPRRSSCAALPAPLLDTVQVVFRRLLERKNPLSSPGKDHLHHRLLARGLSQTRTTLILWGVTLVTNIVAMIVQRMSAAVIVSAAVSIVVLLAFTVWMRSRALKRAARKSAKVAGHQVRLPSATTLRARPRRASDAVATALWLPSTPHDLAMA